MTGLDELMDRFGVPAIRDDGTAFEPGERLHVLLDTAQVSMAMAWAHARALDLHREAKVDEVLQCRECSRPWPCATWLTLDPLSVRERWKREGR